MAPSAPLRPTTASVLLDGGGGGGGGGGTTVLAPTPRISLEDALGAWKDLSSSAPRRSGGGGSGRSGGPYPSGLVSDLSLADLAVSYSSLCHQSVPVVPSASSRIGSPVLGLVAGGSVLKGGSAAKPAPTASRLGPSGGGARTAAAVTRNTKHSPAPKPRAADQPRGSAPVRASYSALDALLLHAEEGGGGGASSDLPPNPFMTKPKLAH